MSYLYDKLREALGGENFKAGVAINNWTPNEVRAIYIMRDFILVADYLKQPRLVTLDIQEVGMDITNRNRRGNLNNLLESRQLSCLEEIYVDYAFMQYKNVIDLGAYVKNALKISDGCIESNSRLRYYGYVRGFNSQIIMGFYSKALLNGYMDYTFANNVGGFMYVDANNKDWYKKYDLRPQYYSMDKDKSKLHIYFTKCERVISDNTVKIDKEAELVNKCNIISKMLLVDVQRASDINYLIEFVKYCDTCDDFIKYVAKYLKDYLSREIIIQGLTKEILQQTCTKGNIEITDSLKFIIDLYNKVQVYDKSSKEFNRECDTYDGIYQLEKRLDYSLSEAVNHCGNENLLFFLLASKRNEEGLPEGKLANALKSKNILACRVTEKGNLDGLVRFTYGVCGFIKSDFISMLTKKENK